MALGPSAVIVAVAALVYFVTLAVYRLYFHPLAKFPGPRAAALTFLYEGYYEVVKVGYYSAHISKLHDLYGPVVRVTPNELHIRDSRFFDDFYAKNLHLDKEGWNTKFGTNDGLLTTVNAAFHKRRRAALSPMYMPSLTHFPIVVLTIYQVLPSLYPRLRPHHLSPHRHPLHPHAGV